MCVLIRRTTRVVSPWDATLRTITIPAQLDADRAVLAVRTVLAELAVPQPASGALCWCGAPVDIGAPQIPAQQHPNEVMARGT